MWIDQRSTEFLHSIQFVRSYWMNRSHTKYSKWRETVCRYIFNRHCGVELAINENLSQLIWIQRHHLGQFHQMPPKSRLPSLNRLNMCIVNCCTIWCHQFYEFILILTSHVPNSSDNEAAVGLKTSEPHASNDYRQTPNIESLLIHIHSCLEQIFLNGLRVFKPDVSIWI